MPLLILCSDSILPTEKRHKTVSFDGFADFYPIAEVNNTLRIIKYVGIMGYRYSSYNLVDMRIHDINAVADLNEHDPNAPSPPDNDDYIPPDNNHDDIPDTDPEGGARPLSTPDADSVYLSILGSAFDYIVTFWTGFWPVLHFVIERYVSELQDTIRIRFAEDLLGCFIFEELHLFTAMGDDSLPDLEEGMTSTNLDLVVGLSFSLALTAITIFEVLYKTSPLSPWTLAAGMAASAAVAFYFYLTIATVWSNLANGLITYGEAAAWIYGLLIGIAVFLLPGVELAGYVSKNTFTWAKKRILNQLSEKGQKIADGVIEKLLWAKIFIALCVVLFIGGFVICYLNAI